MKSKIKVIASIPLLLCVLAHAAPAFSDINTMVDGMIWSDTISPQRFSSSTRTGIALGSMHFRAPNTTFSLYNFSAPRLTVGCGAMDFYGGSFSFINVDEFRQILRQIGQNALGYAFAMALKSMCESCYTTLGDLNAMINKLNMGQLDTCQIAEKMFSPDAWHDAGKQISQKFTQLETDAGVMSDHFEKIQQDAQAPWAWLTSAGTASDGTRTVTNPIDGSEIPVIEYGNQVANILRRINFDSTYGWATSGTDIRAMELVMSLVGTVVLKEGGTTDSQSAYISSKDFDLTTLVTGGKDTNDGSHQKHTELVTCETVASDTCGGAKQRDGSFDGLSGMLEAKLTAALTDAETGNLNSSNTPILYLLDIPFLKTVREVRPDHDAVLQATLVAQEYGGRRIAYEMARRWLTALKSGIGAVEKDSKFDFCGKIQGQRVCKNIDAMLGDLRRSEVSDDHLRARLEATQLLDDIVQRYRQGASKGSVGGRD